MTAQDLRHLIETYTRDYPQQYNQENIWRSPLVATARADQRFDLLPRIAARDHLLPRDLLPTAQSVVVFFIPFGRTLARENHKDSIPCRNWGLAYEATNRLINRLCQVIQAHFKTLGYASALVPATHNFDPDRLMARWSHKHLGHIAGLGRFGVNAQFITPSGCAGRLGSLVTEADLGDSPLIDDLELCIHKRGGRCLVCVDRCPVGAVSPESGINRKLCWERLKSNLAETEQLKGLDETTHVCGKCQVLVPCSLKVPGTGSGMEKL